MYTYIYVYVCTQSMYVYLLIRIQGGGGQRRLSAACSSLPLRFIRRIYREAGRLDSSFYEPIPSWDKQNGPILKVFFVSRERERKRERYGEWKNVEIGLTFASFIKSFHTYSTYCRRGEPVPSSLILFVIPADDHG